MNSIDSCCLDLKNILMRMYKCLILVELKIRFIKLVISIRNNVTYFKL